MNLRALIAAALDEDIGPGDLTTEATVPRTDLGVATIYAKQDLIVSGHEPAAETFRQVAERAGAEVRYRPVRRDGQEVVRGSLIAEIDGPLAVLLTAERVALNFMMHLSGIATHTRAYVNAAQGHLRVVDTRKCTPLLRGLEKAAVRHGGAYNHRFALYDGVMIKDNHISAVGSIPRAIAQAREGVHHLIRIEVEVTNLHELDEAIGAGADVILLDNMDDDTLAAAVKRTREQRPEVILEASGNITPERITRIRDLGLDVVSSGGLIHQAVWVDLSMDLRTVPAR
jgi:nicotinate-nucleotide pyrophosphorylase (carboxylating)